ncbi:hypothetical protein VPH35_001432 [Triticum aestivum]
MAVCGWAVSTRGAAAMCISSCGGTRRMGWSLLQWRTTKGRGAAPPQWRTMTRRCRRREIPIETCSGGKVRARGDSGSKATAADRCEHPSYCSLSSASSLLAHHILSGVHVKTSVVVDIKIMQQPQIFFEARSTWI